MRVCVRVERRGVYGRVCGARVRGAAHTDTGMDVVQSKFKSRPVNGHRSNTPRPEGPRKHKCSQTCLD